MIARITPTQTKKNVDAIRLADIGLSLPTLCNRRTNATPVTTASTKLITEKIIETFCKKRFFLANWINLPELSIESRIVTLCGEACDVI